MVNTIACHNKYAYNSNVRLTHQNNMQATITTKGQVVIPIEIRRKLDLTSGAQVRVEEKDGVILLKPTGKALFSKLNGCVDADLLTELKEYKSQDVEK